MGNIGYKQNSCLNYAKTWILKQEFINTDVIQILKCITVDHIPGLNRGPLICQNTVTKLNWKEKIFGYKKSKLDGKSVKGLKKMFFNWVWPPSGNVHPFF